jgi:hypothetical protein
MDKLICDYCQKEILADEDVQRIPPQETVGLGQKSGRLVLFPHRDYEHDEEIVLHAPECAISWWDPNDNPVLLEEVKDVLRVDKDFLEEILATIDCIFCKKPDFVWHTTAPVGVIHSCQKCHKMWNDEEEEITV